MYIQDGRFTVSFCFLATVYRDSESTPMVCCDICQRWVHRHSDNIRFGSLPFAFRSWRLPHTTALGSIPGLHVATNSGVEPPPPIQPPPPPPLRQSSQTTKHRYVIFVL
ncbi:hypothetical protein Ahy_B03g067442 isoform C [Arachis hypogaea]|uniref:Uncharacterized protein n=1 Tax=Arachis hypogaea TaxID=3818 RepID=A0A445A6T4_ARAHY|nr:hypothetical protein Ahy_B03g067442 isoform C [Arachis hypogaea]